MRNLSFLKLKTCSSYFINLLLSAAKNLKELFLSSWIDNELEVELPPTIQLVDVRLVIAFKIIFKHKCL